MTIKQFTGRQVGLTTGVLALLLVWVLPVPSGLTPAAWLTLGCLLLMSTWWMTSALPMAVTALLPLVLFPLLDIKDIRPTAAAYANPTIYLFMGGFLLALAIEKCQLHRRIALFVLIRTSASSRHLVAGFMLVAAFLSMWISNTATTVMLLPIGLAILAITEAAMPEVDAQEKKAFQSALLLSIAYAATIGGVATLIGTPPNAYMAAFLLENYQFEVSFIRWMSVGLIVTAVLLPLAWLLLTRVVFRFSFANTDTMRAELLRHWHELGPVSADEKKVAAVFACTALAWAFRPLLNQIEPLSALSDASIAIAAGVVLFLLPNRQGGHLLDWPDTQKLPWGILVLFGGGLALAGAVSTSGLATAIGATIAGLGIIDLAGLVLVVTLVIIFLTEVSGNLATVATFLPVIAAVSVAVGVDPVVLVVPVALAASCAFMLPVATPPNAIIYAADKVTIPQMAKAGLLLNVAAIILVTLLSLFAVPALLLAGQ
ncbi:MAG: SLC13 family permease [Gammaproteobacteria bacterium]